MSATDLSDPIFWIPTIIGIAAVIPLYIELLNRWRRRSIEFEIERFRESTKKPVESEWSVRILHPDKMIERCSILYNDTTLPWWDSDEIYYVRKIVRSGGGNVRIPKSMETTGGEIKVKNNSKVLKKIKFEDILATRP